MTEDYNILCNNVNELKFAEKYLFDKGFIYGSEYTSTYLKCFPLVLCNAFKTYYLDLVLEKDFDYEHYKIISARLYTKLYR